MTIDRDTMLLLNAYHDGELSPSETLAMDARLAREPELALRLDALRSISTATRKVLPGEAAPDRLRASVLASIGQDMRLASNDEDLEVSPLTPWRAIAASLMIGLLGGATIGGYAVYSLQQQQEKGQLENEIVTAHLRALIAPQPFDIASSDNHVVKPWFNGRTTIAPITPDLASEGFALIGGRVDLIGGKPVPVMTYRRNRHIISVTALEREGDDAGPLPSIVGTNVVEWTGGGLTYIAASDVNPADLATFAKLFREQLPTPR